MDEVLGKMREQLAKQSGKATKKLAHKLGGWVDGAIVVLAKTRVELAWDVSNDTPHAVRAGVPDDTRWIEVTRRRRASGTLRIERRNPNLQNADARDRSHEFATAAGLDLPLAYVVEASPHALFADALDANNARALLDFTVSKVAVGHGGVRVRAHEWPGRELPGRRVRSLEDVQALVDLVDALAEA